MANRLSGTVRQAIFMGNLTDLFVDVGTAKLRVQMSTVRPFREGEPIELSVPEEAIRVLEREAV